ncbi:unnamed protein product [Urochloa humidicola]
MASYRVGDPELRPDHDSVHIPTSFEIDRELRDWEGNTLVTWAMRVPPSTTARNLEDAIIADLRLRQGDVDVTRHRPEAFLIRFQNRRHCEDLLARGKFSYHGVEVCVRPWRSLTGARGAAMFYRVRLVLDGVPRHAWQPDIVERLIGRTCALQCIDTNLLHPVDTRGIELWAWTADPSRIPKVMWLIFTTGTLEGSSSSVQISEIPPSRWQRGINHPVLIHIWEVHNYSSVTTDPQEPDVAIGKPERRRLPWFWGVKDGDQEPTPAFPPLGHPPPPRVTGRRDERQEADRRNRERRDRSEAERRARGEHHPDFHDLRGRHRDDHQDDCDRDRWGRNLRRYGCSRDAYGARRDVPRRERSRSPRRREAGHGYNGGRRRPESPTANDIEEGRKNNLKVAAMKDASSSVFNLQGKVPSASATPCSPLQMFRNISRLAEQEGNEPWSNYTSNKQNKLLQARMHTTVPVRRAYYRIKNALPIVNAPSIQEVNDALSKLAHAIQPGEEQVQPAPEPVTPIRTPTESEPTTPADAEMATINTATPTSAQICTPTTPDAVPGEHLSGVADLFVTPEPGILA